MRKFFFGGTLVFLAVCVFLAGSWFGSRQSGRDAQKAGRPILYYVDPMNPAHTSDKPGIAPCGMNMEPVYADDTNPEQSAAAILFSMAPGTVRIGLEKQQVLGIRVGTVEKTSIIHTLRTTGRVVVDETRIYRINAAVDGWITDAKPVSTWSFIRKNETIASFYSPEFLSAQQALLFALNSMDRVQTTGREVPARKDQITQFHINIRQYKDSLKNLGMGDLQIEELIRTREYTENINITAPADGFILARNISQGQRFDKGTELYRIADLSHVWVVADVFQNEAGYAKPGIKVKVIQPQQKREFSGTVSDVLPQFDASSRTMKVRLELDNPGYLLRPDMFVDVEFPIQLPAAITVPADALIDSGKKKTVFVDRGNGFFEPREVETGWRLGDRIEITKGLGVGERIVISGAFLIDSESRMKSAAAAMQATTPRPLQATPQSKNAESTKPTMRAGEGQSP